MLILFKTKITTTLAGPSESRWFDKSFSLIVSQNGNAFINFEHSWGDGACIIRLINDIVRDSDASPVVNKEMIENSHTYEYAFNFMFDY